MANVAPAFADNAGEVYASPEAAVLSDLAAALGRTTADSGITGGLAMLILDKRAEIERAFADLDAMTGAAK
ncbi:MAG: hypothetical protein KGL44_03765 [Sphingomonadales bacterium]|nr:hypothetical protein [Sphingomonadales bacterium]